MICAALDSLPERMRSVQHGGLPTNSVRDHLIYAAVASGDMPAAHLFSDLSSRPQLTTVLQRFVDSGHVIRKPLVLLPALAEEHEYLFVSNCSDALALGSLRDDIGRLQFPLCIGYTPPTGPDILGAYVATRLRLHPCDSIVVGSVATRKALEYAWELVRQWSTREALAAQPEEPLVEEIPRCVDETVFRPRPKAQCRDALGLPREKMVILCDETAVRTGGEVGELVYLLRELQVRHPELFVAIARADGPSDGNLQAALNQAGLSVGVSVFTKTPAEVKPLLYSAADICLLLDVTLDGESELDALEAMASAVAVVAVDWGATREFLQDGLNGILVPTYWNPIAGAMMSWMSSGAFPHRFLSDRTIVDAGALASSVELLLSRPEERSRLASGARGFIEKSRSAATASRALMQLWSKQVEALHRDGSETHTPIVDYSRMFKHYATRELDMDVVLRITPRGRSLLGDPLHPPDVRGIPPLLRRDSMRILEASCSAVRVADCVTSESQFSFEAIVWLLRKGYLCQANSPDDDRLRATVGVDATTGDAAVVYSGSSV
jgi:hypothetical protein